jgi:hypothetical protein
MPRLIYKYSYLFYLRYLRRRIYYINSAEDIILIFKNISFFFPKISCDQLTEIIIDSFKIIPLTEIEIQKLSILQQYYQNDLGIRNFATFLIWTAYIYSMQEHIPRLPSTIYDYIN